MTAALDGWRSVQGRGPDGAIESDERVTAAYPVVDRSERGARRLGDLYWQEVRRASRGIVRRRDTAELLELRLFGRGPCLLRFGSAQTTVEPSRVCCRYPIEGGLLARRPGGSLTLSQTGEQEPELRAAISGFVPRLASRRGLPDWSSALYDQGQRRLHVRISRRYFRRLIEEPRS